ncbi:MAG TPA: DEAD/DEAH box helicase [Bacteroidia bacterium]|nr:DEAD/DEAH box helicase [Bacteroidia bacterium]
MNTSPIEIATLHGFIASDEWRRRFDASALAAGSRLVSGRQVSGVVAELLETGDAEICGTVTEKDGTSYRPVLAIWREGETLSLEGDCGCGGGGQCPHAAALLLYLAKGDGARLASALGGNPHAEKMMAAPILADPVPSAPAPAATGSGTPKFLLRVRKRSDGERFAWLPEVFAEAFAVYEGHRTPLNPGGAMPPLVLPDRKLARSRADETTALNTLYALDLNPGVEEPPQSLRKLDRPDAEGTLWAPDAKKWPHPEFYWLRFRHDGVAALERRGWEVRFAPEVGHRPLVFRTEGWSAEIVEEGKGWFHLSAGFEIDGESFELQPILAALVKNRFLEATEGLPDGQEFLVLLPDGRGLVLPVGRFRRLLAVLGELVDFRFEKGPMRLGKLDAALLAEDDESESLPMSAPPTLASLGEGLRSFQSIERVEAPPGLRAELRPYQLEGYQWMQFLLSHGLNGILADDMGLGKTLQTLAHLLAEVASGRNGGKPSLVIAPTSVVMNWQREAAKFAPDLSVLILQGADRKARFRQIGRTDLVLTSYALLHRDLDALREHEFHLLVLDEAQHIKNPDAQVSRAAAALRASHRLCLSGTPVENHLGELWSLMEFLMPGWLGTLDLFRSRYQTPIEKDGNEARRAALARRVGPLILRRTKHDVAKELPPKTEIVHEIEMEEAQKDLYETARSTMDKQVRQALAIRGQQAQIVFLDALLKLRQICCHPRLLGEDHAASGSAKFEYLVELLATLREEGHRTLVFSQFTSMLGLVERHLVQEGVPYLVLTGETKNRQELVERFQSGEGQVFLISLKAGGTGLTLTGADTVIHYDPWWNPAAENQATDRAYRIGQDKPVFVHKLICRNTVEQRIQRMQEKKDDLASDLLSGAARGIDLSPDAMGQLLAGFD